MPGAVLRVGGSKKGIRNFLAKSRITPTRVYFKGEPTSPGSAILARWTYFLVQASGASGDDFRRQTRDALRFFRRHERELRTLAKHRLHAVLDFGVHDIRSKDRVLLSWRLPLSLVRLLGAAGIEAEISLYNGPKPPSNEPQERA